MINLCVNAIKVPLLRDGSTFRILITEQLINEIYKMSYYFTTMVHDLIFIQEISYTFKDKF